MGLSARLFILFLTAGGILFLTGCSALSSAPGRGKDVNENKPVVKPVEDNSKKTADSIVAKPSPDKEDNTRIPVENDPQTDDTYYYLPENENISMEDIIMHNVENLSEKQKQNGDKLIMNIIKYFGTPYVWGRNTRNGLDCSGFTKLVFQEAFGLTLFRVARDQFTQGEAIPALNDLQLGDLVFFDTRPSSRPGHVGIYLGNRLFAHASTKQGVIVSSFDTKYYNEKFMGGRRFKELFDTE
ncbi:hypothetical protein MASR1M107_25230 [Ignavibacteriales bacterium]